MWKLVLTLAQWTWVEDEYELTDKFYVNENEDR